MNGIFYCNPVSRWSCSRGSSCMIPIVHEVRSSVKFLTIRSLIRAVKTVRFARCWTRCLNMYSSVDQRQTQKSRRNRRPIGRQLLCPVHQDQILRGNGKKYFLHLLSAEALQQRGMPAKTAQLVINAYPVFVLSNEWLEELFCEQCGNNHWWPHHQTFP